MKEAWQHNAEFGGYAEPLPDLPPPEFDLEDDMARHKKPSALATFTLHLKDGTQVGPIIVSDELPTDDYDVAKAFAFLAARAAEQAKRKTKHGRHD